MKEGRSDAYSAYILSQALSQACYMLYLINLHTPLKMEGAEQKGKENLYFINSTFL